MKKECSRIQIKIEVIKLPYVHHGGAWKVAYADFMTAMMAFFLLMWLLNMAPQDQKEAIAEYFTPPSPMVSDSRSGSGGLFGGLTMTPEGARTSDRKPIAPIKESPDQSYRGGGKDPKSISIAQSAERSRFEAITEKIKQAILENKELEKMEDNIDITITPEGLRIELIDQEDETMFPSGSANMFDKTRKILTHITDAILEMPNLLSIRGHTDGVRYSEGAIYTNWELSADRANAVRRALIDSGFPLDRVNNVMGKADTKPLIEDNPLDPRNRRITLILLNQTLPDTIFNDEEMGIGEEKLLDGSEMLNYKGTAQINPYRKTPGTIEFP
ncbi:MAG: OmpA family protein [Alphaproteobacteria bacterium]|nr:OmpA family protein [Alphaproteobacteria bacterium]